MSVFKQVLLSVVVLLIAGGLWVAYERGTFDRFLPRAGTAQAPGAGGAPQGGFVGGPPGGGGFGGPAVFGGGGGAARGDGA